MPDQVIVFTDLDGTLLDYYTYAFGPSLEGIALLRENHIPLIFCTSKSYAEVVYFREKTGNTSPYIVENGGAIYLPGEHAYLAGQEKRCSHIDGTAVLELGAPYDRVRRVLADMKKEFGDMITGFGDMSEDEVASYLNLPLELAVMAKRRRHDEPFILKDPSLLEGIERFARSNGLRVFPGTRFYHLMGETDKGAAVRTLMSLYRKHSAPVMAAAVGEGKNDIPMFREVRMPFLVQRPDGTFTDTDIEGITRIPAIGPDGFTRAVKVLLGRIKKM